MKTGYHVKMNRGQLNDVSEGPFTDNSYNFKSLFKNYFHRAADNQPNQRHVLFL